MKDVTHKLARFVVTTPSESVPSQVRKEAVRSFFNWIGCAVGGSGHAAVDIALSAFAPFAGAKQAVILGRNERLDILNASLLNGIASHVFDFDDTHLKTIIHPAGPVASAILSLAQLRPTSGRDFLHAFILGIEVECRIGNAVYPAHYDIGWHITGTTGVFGAAAAAGRLLGLNEQQMTWALGIAGTQSSGFREMFGTMCKSFHPGRAAQNGLAASLLAQKNFTSSDRVLEAPRGFANVMSIAHDLSAITENLGASFEVSLNTYKPFACGIVVHPAIDGCIALRNEFALTADQIERVDLRVAPLVLELTGKEEPKVGLEGKFSVYHSAAVAIFRGRAREEEYSDACVQDPRIVSLRRRVSVVASPQIREDECYVKITLKDGRVLEKHIEHALGSLERPMTDADLEDKFRSLSEPILGSAGANRLLDLCWRIEALPDVSEIAAAAIPHPAAVKSHARG